IPKMGTFNLHLGKLPEYRGGYVPIDKTGRLEGYYTLPTYEGFRAFYGRGCRLI
ncbi:MAG: hypothetical protein JNN08_26315, partial [Bryobacterales bacterium]|nr:hypothetical protein [Bryobacterales bacterium]